MKRSRKIFFGILAVLLLHATCGFAQQEFKLKGVLFENGAKIRIALAEISNLRNGYAVGSNDLGIFEIKAQVGDTLLITKRGFNDLTVVVGSPKDLVLKLNRGNMLNEVVIKGQGKEQELRGVEKDFKDKGSFYAGKPPLALLSPFGGSPLTFLYELFGKTPRDARRFRRYHQSENEQTYVDQFFNKSIINKNTGLEGKELEDFMVAYRPDYERAKNWNSYDGLKWIAESYKKYKDSLKLTQ